MLKFLHEHRCKHSKGKNTSEVFPGMQDWLNIGTSISILYHLLSNKGENHMINCIDAEKLFDESKHPFSIKTFKKTGIKSSTLIKGI